MFSSSLRTNPVFLFAPILMVIFLTVNFAGYDNVLNLRFSFHTNWKGKWVKLLGIFFFLFFFSLHKYR